MAGAATAFLAGLDDQQRASANLPFTDDAARRDWHYIPRSRGGLAFGEMTSKQEKLAHYLVQTGLSLHAYAQVAAIVALEDVLDAIEEQARGRTRTDYSTTVFGDPTTSDPWGWRFEGHHVSLNVTVVDGSVVSATPHFLGANPAEVGHAHASVLRPLAAEEDLARALLGALEPHHRESAVVNDVAPDDILTEARPRVTDDAVPDEGVRFGELDGRAAELFEALLGTYIARLPDVLAARSGAKLESSLGDIRFVWAGETGRRQPHYYRLHGPGVLIEYDNTQNDANHIHTVWRDPNGDFGDDLLAEHHARHHSAATSPGR